MDKLNTTPIETEVKYLIRMPDISQLCCQPDLKAKEIVQTYLISPNGITRRVREVTTDKETNFVLTEKRRISALSSFEDERMITPDEYRELLKVSDPERIPIKKTRYAFSHDSHLIEIDIYPFWSDRAILEIELASEAEEYSIPPFISVIKNVTDDSRYKNARLAKEIVFDDID